MNIKRLIEIRTASNLDFEFDAYLPHQVDFVKLMVSMSTLSSGAGFVPMSGPTKNSLKMVEIAAFLQLGKQALG